MAAHLELLRKEKPWLESPSTPVGASGRAPPRCFRLNIRLNMLGGFPKGGRSPAPHVGRIKMVLPIAYVESLNALLSVARSRHSYGSVHILNGAHLICSTEISAVSIDH